MSSSNRRIVTFNHISADGFFAAVDGSLTWTVPEPAVYGAATSSFGGIDAMLFGRKTYDQFEAFWPNALEEGSKTAADPHAPGQRSEQLHDMAVWINDVRKLVISRTRTSFPWKNSELIPACDAAVIRGLKAQPGENIIIFGSGSIVSELTKHGLIDEYAFVVSPVLLGKGHTLLEHADAKRSLELIEAKTFPSGVILTRYAPAK